VSELVLRSVVLLAAALAAGALVVPRAALVDGLDALAGTCAATGLALLAAVLAAASALGLPKGACAGLAFALAAGGLLRLVQLRPSAKPGFGRRLALALGLLALLHPGLLLALRTPPILIDAVTCWWPKMVEAANGAAPRPDLFIPDTQPFYPRGVPWLAALASLGTEPDGRMIRLVPLLWWWSTLVALAELGARLGAPRAAAALAILVALVPEAAACAHAGYVDTAISGCVLLSGAGLTLARADARWALVVAVAGAGAASAKEEGSVLLAVVVLLLGAELLARRLAPGAFVAALVIAALALPWWSVRTSYNLVYASLIRPVLGDPWLFVDRLGVTLRELLDMHVRHAPSTYDDGAPTFIAWAWTTCALLACAGSRVRVAPALLLAGTYVLVFAATPETSVRWIVSLSAERLMTHTLPLLALGVALLPALAARGDAVPAGGVRAPAS
jgi:hypothetical protein